MSVCASLLSFKKGLFLMFFFFVCVYVSVYISALGRKKGIASPGAAITEGCELPSLGDGSCNWALKEQTVLLTTELSLQPQLLSSLSKTKYLIIFKNSIHEQNIFSSHLPLTFPLNSPGIHYCTSPNSCPPPFF